LQSTFEDGGAASGSSVPEETTLNVQGVAVPVPEQDANAKPVDQWNAARIDVAQLIWGRGFCGPGGPEHVIAQSKLLALTPELSMMHLGAGLGGPARTLAEHFGVWMTGYELSASLVASGNELSTMAGMIKKAPLVLLNPVADQPFERRYDRALADMFFSSFEDKAALITKAEAALKPEGLILATDYVLADDAAAVSDAFRTWRDNEPKRLHISTAEDLEGYFAQAGFSIRVNEDMSADYMALITNAWAGADRAVAELMQTPGQGHMAKVLLREAELWNRRVAMLKSGVLQYRRILASKKADKAGIKTMSNW
jgi:hypothetical protein